MNRRQQIDGANELGWVSRMLAKHVADETRCASVYAMSIDLTWKKT